MLAFPREEGAAAGLGLVRQVLQGRVAFEGGCVGGGEAWEAGCPFRVFLSWGARSEDGEEDGAGRALASLDEVALKLKRSQVDSVVAWNRRQSGRGASFFLIIQGRGRSRGPSQAYIFRARQLSDGSVTASGVVGTPRSGMAYKYSWEVECSTPKILTGKSKCSMSVESISGDPDDPDMAELCKKTATCNGKAKVVLESENADGSRGRIDNDSGSGND